MGKKENLETLGGIAIVAIILLSMLCYVIPATTMSADNSASNAQISRCVETCEQHLMGHEPTVSRQNKDGSVTCKCIQSFTINKEANNVTSP